MAKIHTIDKRDWDRRTWKFPLIHNFNFGFGLTADSASITKRSTIQPYLFQDDLAIDLETIMTNPANAGFMVDAQPNVTSVGRSNLSVLCSNSFTPFHNTNVCSSSVS